MMNSKEINLPLVTVVIPTYNNATYIADAVKSVMEQDYKNLEIIIIDDASADNTEHVIAQFKTDSRIKYFKNEHNIGRVATYHKGLYELAKGEWYLNVDGDDYLTDQTFISKAINWIQQFDNVVMVAASCERLVDGKLDYIVRSKYEHELSCIDGKNYFLDLPEGKAYFSHLSTLYNRAKAIGLNFYCEDILSADFESLYRLILTGNIVSYDKVVGVWRIHGENVSSRNFFSAEDIIRNFKFVENTALFAITYLPNKKIKSWRKVYLVKIIESYILQVIITKPKNSIAIIFRLFKKYPVFFIQACMKTGLRKGKKSIQSVRK